MGTRRSPCDASIASRRQIPKRSVSVEFQEIAPATVRDASTWSAPKSTRQNRHRRHANRLPSKIVDSVLSSPPPRRPDRHRQPRRLLMNSRPWLWWTKSAWPAARRARFTRLRDPPVPARRRRETPSALAKNRNSCRNFGQPRQSISKNHAPKRPPKNCSNDARRAHIAEGALETPTKLATCRPTRRCQTAEQN